MRAQSVYFSAVKILVMLNLICSVCVASQQDHLLEIKHQAEVKAVSNIMWYQGVLVVKESNTKKDTLPEELEIALQKID